MEVFTFVLLECMDSDAPFYQQTADGKRVQLKKIPVHRPTLRQTFQDKDGVTKTIRYKANSNFILQDDQIEKEKIDANVPFTTREYRDPEFKWGTCMTTKKTLKEYLLAHPESLSFEGTCDDVREPRYRLLDETADTKLKNSDIRQRLAAANKVMALTDLGEAQALIIRLNGFQIETPNDLEECQNRLMEFIDDANDAGIESVLKEEKDINIDDQTTVLIGKLLNAKIISFDAVEGKISKKDKNGKWSTMRDMSAEYPLEERKRLFSDFLNTEDGKPLKIDLEKSLINKK